MAQTLLDNSNISVHLGKTSEYKSQYDASLLVREPRSNNRKHLDISDDNIPFYGNDTWNAYEISALTHNGLPVAGIGKIVYPCSSKYIVESKSIKLYFNSFNMTKLAKTADEVRDAIAAHASRDLSQLLETDVQVKVFSNYEAICEQTSAVDEYMIDEYETLENIYDDDGEVTVYQETPKLLKVIDHTDHRGYNRMSYKYHSALLKSNCRVTSQPDFGDILIHYNGSKTVTPESLLRYIISFRDECHFHEEICETIYKRLHDVLQPDALSVICLYARRGGIDINPERVSCETLLHGSLSNIEYCHIKTTKQ
jgi:7-cyano-7-deazaguanine reductase